MHTYMQIAFLTRDVWILPSKIYPRTYKFFFGTTPSTLEICYKSIKLTEVLFFMISKLKTMGFRFLPESIKMCRTKMCFDELSNFQSSF